MVLMDDDTGKQMIDLADYYSGGYFLVRAENPERYAQFISKLQVDKLVSLSTILCPRLAVHWGWNPGDREAALKFGIPAEKLDEFVEWCNEAHYIDIEHPSMFTSLDAARRIVARFLPNPEKLYLVNATLHKEVAQMEWHLPSVRGEASYGIEKRINQGLSVEAGGIPLGFEAISFNYNDFGYSGLCDNPYVYKQINEQFGIQPNPFGLLQTRTEAQQVCDWMMETDENGNHRAEPEPYAYWLLVSYPLSAEG